MSQQTLGDRGLAASARYSKRTRIKVNYCEEVSDAGDTPDSDSESQVAQEQLRSKKQKSTPPSKSRSKRKSFLFLELPAEIRNMIYSYCLSDPRGVYLVSNTKHHRRTVKRAGRWYMMDVYDQERSGQRQHEPHGCRISGWYHRNPHVHEQAAHELDDELKEFLTEDKWLVPSLLAVNKQIYMEGREILYGNDFQLDGTHTLHSFLVDIGPRAASLLVHVTLRSWALGRSVHKAYNHTCFSMLMPATNIQTFRIEGFMQRSRPKAIAAEVYRDGFPWLEAVGIAKAKVDAGVDLVKISKLAPSAGRLRYSSADFREDEKEFRNELSRLLCHREEKMKLQTKLAPEPKPAKKVPKERWN